MIYIGIDVGAKGGISAINEHSEVLFSVPMSRENLVDKMNQVKFWRTEWNCGAIACVEKVGAMPGQGVTGMFNFGKGAGYIEGVLETLQIPYQLIPPQRWKKEFGLIHKEKKDSIEICKHLFPEINLLPTERCRKDSDGMAESTLMAEFARRKF